MRRSRGFTLVEILIAVAILGVGVAGIIALFPATIQTASRAVEDTYAASIADSVVASLSAARREHKIFRALAGNAPNVPPTKYLILDHDGVLDPLATPIPGPNSGDPKGSTYYASNESKDFVVLLPRANGANNTNPANEPMIFCPSTGTPSRSPGTIQSNIADEVQLKDTAEGKKIVWIQKTFPLGRYRSGTAPSGFNTGDVRAEFLPAGSTNAANLPIDQYPQYSFAIGLRRAKRLDASGKYSSNLYECHVFIFRNFDPGANASISGGGLIPRTNEPIHEYVTMLDVGPKGDQAGPGPLTAAGQFLNSASGAAGPPPFTPNGDSTEDDPWEEW